MPVVGSFRTPAVAKICLPQIKSFNISNNYYFQRDTRRNYPRLAVYTQKEVAGLLEGAAVNPSIPVELESQVATTTEAKPLVEVLNSRQLYSASKLPPTSNFGIKPKWKISEDFIPPNDGSYFPMKVITT
ncbi:unnamed protein product [Rhizopus stolonifer]